MIRISPREYRLLRYAQTDSPDLSRDNLAAVAKCVPVSIGRILTALRKRGLITIKRGPNRKILAIETTFEFVRNKAFYVDNPPRTRYLT